MEDIIVSLFCKHDYSLYKEYEMKSQLQMMIEKGLTSIENINKDVILSKYYVVYKCNKCNKLKERIIINL